VFLRREGEEPDAAERTALRVALVVHIGGRGALRGAELREATGAVIEALAQGAEPEDAFGAGILTYLRLVAA
jgi:hypothetical protein